MDKKSEIDVIVIIIIGVVILILFIIFIASSKNIGFNILGSVGNLFNSTI